MAQSRTLILMYQYFHPDEVISARLFSDMAQEMAEHGWRVVAMPASRDCHEGHSLPLFEDWGKVTIRRVWRPGFRQSSFIGRIANAIFLLMGWSWRALFLRRSSHETIIVGTDPIMGVLAAIPWRLFRPKTRIIHWCHDLHPEAAIADGVLSEKSVIVSLLRVPLRWAYACSDVVVDLGSCMRSLMIHAESKSISNSDSRHQTVTPWALVEPAAVVSPIPEIRVELFGNAKLAFLYSGNLGRAHQFELFLQLARRLENRQTSRAVFCFAGRGARLADLKCSLTAADTNIAFAGFAKEEQLQSRLAAGDVHLVSLREAWTGTVVPSKFFGALAIGRPVLFVGSSESAIAGWIEQYKIGWHLTQDNIETVTEELERLAAEPLAKQQLNQHCFAIYHQHFSRACMMNLWHHILQSEMEGMVLPSTRI